MKWLKVMGIVLAVGMMITIVSGCPLRRRPEPIVEEVIEEIEVIEEVKIIEEVAIVCPHCGKPILVAEIAEEVVEKIVMPEVYIRYTVRRGDSLWSIADSFYGEPLRWEEIWEVNRDQLPTPDALEVGMVLIIPKD